MDRYEESAAELHPKRSVTNLCVKLALRYVQIVNQWVYPRGYYFVIILPQMMSSPKQRSIGRSLERLRIVKSKITL